MPLAPVPIRSCTFFQIGSRKLIPEPRPPQMVADRRFRNDLYYRLNVSGRIAASASDARHSDASRHFIQQFARVGWVGGSRASRPRLWTSWFATFGRAASGRCKTSSNAVLLSPDPSLRVPRRPAARGHARPGAGRGAGHPAGRRTGAHRRRPPRNRWGGRRSEGGRGLPWE